MSNSAGHESILRKLALLGLAAGLFITFLNFIQVNYFLITMGSALILSSLVHLLCADKLGLSLDDTRPRAQSLLRVLDVIYWILLALVALATRSITPSSGRPLVLFVLTSITVGLLAVEVLLGTTSDQRNNSYFVFRIILLSVVFRATGYFVTAPYPVGSDPWAHMEYVKNFLSYGHIRVAEYPAGTGMDRYYCFYPFFHLVACAAKLVLGLSVYNTFFVMSSVLTLSMVFLFLLVRLMTANPKISLFSILLLGFADHHINWSIQVIAMTYGIALFGILIYLLFKEEKLAFKYRLLSISFILSVVWTHTISAFICLVFFVGLLFAGQVHKLASDSQRPSTQIVSFHLCIFFGVLLLYHWMDPGYPFIDSVIIGLKKALSSDVSFVSGATPLDRGRLIGGIGFAVYLLLSFIDIYRELGGRDGRTMSLILGCLLLMFVTLLFMAFGLNNIVPSRWWAFIYVVLSFFAASGLLCLANFFRSISKKALFVSVVLATSTFSMITNADSNVDARLYEPCLKLSWSQAEILLFKHMCQKYGGMIISDQQTIARPIKTYLKRYDAISYPLTELGQLDWESMRSGMVIWTRDSLYKRVWLSREGCSAVLGKEFEKRLNENFDCIGDTYEARAYLGRMG